MTFFWRLRICDLSKLSFRQWDRRGILFSFTLEKSTLSKTNFKLFQVGSLMANSHHHKICLASIYRYLFFLNQFVTSFNSVLIYQFCCCYICLKIKWTNRILNGSTVSKAFLMCLLYLMYNINESGPNIEPWGTPYNILKLLHLQLLL